MIMELKNLGEIKHILFFGVPSSSLREGKNQAGSVGLHQSSWSVCVGGSRASDPGIKNQCGNFPRGDRHSRDIVGWPPDHHNKLSHIIFLVPQYVKQCIYRINKYFMLKNSSRHLSLLEKRCLPTDLPTQGYCRPSVCKKRNYLQVQ